MWENRCLYRSRVEEEQVSPNNLLKQRHGYKTGHNKVVIITGSHNFEIKVGLQDDYKQAFETKTQSPFPGTGNIEPFIVMVTEGNSPNFEKQILSQTGVNLVYL